MNALIVSEAVIATAWGVFCWIGWQTQIRNARKALDLYDALRDAARNGAMICPQCIAVLPGEHFSDCSPRNPPLKPERVS